jgi:hypothetical protein
LSLDWSRSDERPAERYTIHNHDSRDGLYIDSAFTPDAAANLTRDLNFDGTISGNVYAQPLRIDGGLGEKAMIIAANRMTYMRSTLETAR